MTGRNEKVFVIMWAAIIQLLFILFLNFLFVPIRALKVFISTHLFGLHLYPLKVKFFVCSHTVIIFIFVALYSMCMCVCVCVLHVHINFVRGDTFPELHNRIWCDSK